MASLAKTNKSFQRLHRERHQPQSRHHLGFLEKKKDYKARALDYQKKEKTLKLLKEKVANKNPNEFTFHMVNSQLKDGRHYEQRKDGDRNGDIKVVEGKNMKFLNWKRGIELKKIERLKSELHFINVEGEPVNKHIIFKEGPKKKLKQIEVTKSDITAPDEGSSSSKQRQIKPIKLTSRKLAAYKKEKDRAYQTLMRRLEREKQLRALVENPDFSLKKHKKKNKFNDDNDDDDD